MADVNVDLKCNDHQELYNKGVRAFVMNDFEVAVSALGQASSLLAAEHKDDMHESLADVYLYYGKALLGLWRAENRTLGEAVAKKTAENGDEEEDEEVEEEEEEAEEGGDQEDQKDNGLTSSSADQSTSAPPKETEKEEENPQPEPTSTEEDDEVDGDLQVAWEVLELAKKIFEKKDDKAKLIEAMVNLGDVSLESGNFDTAIQDIKSAFEIQKKFCDKENRKIAETLYSLAMAYVNNGDSQQATDSFKEAVEYLKNRLETLEKLESPSEEEQKEIEEIKVLIPDMEERIADLVELLKEDKETTKTALINSLKSKSTNGAGTSSSSNGDSSGSSKPATDISHLVKRKRKLEEEDKPGEESPAKKPAA